MEDVDTPVESELSNHEEDDNNSEQEPIDSNEGDNGLEQDGGDEHEVNQSEEIANQDDEGDDVQMPSALNDTWSRFSGEGDEDAGPEPEDSEGNDAAPEEGEEEGEEVDTEPEPEEDPEEVRRRKEAEVIENNYISSIFGSASEDEAEETAPVYPFDQEGSEESDYETTASQTLRKLVKNKNLPKKRKSSGALDDKEPKKRKRANLDGEEVSLKKLMKDKKARPTKKSKRSEQEVIEAVQAFMEKMQDVFQDDLILEENHQPAFGKFNFLPELESFALNASFQEQLVEHDMLVEFTKWLSPNQDRSLPNVRIREVLLNILSKLDKSYINSDIIKDSGIGKIIHFYAIHPKETPKNRKIADDTFNKWYRHVSRKSDSMESEISEQEYAQMRRNRASSNKSKARNVGSFGQRRAEEASEADNYRHARVPQAAPLTFYVRPVVTPVKAQVDNSIAATRRLAKLIKKR